MLFICPHVAVSLSTEETAVDPSNPFVMILPISSSVRTMLKKMTSSMNPSRTCGLCPPILRGPGIGPNGPSWCFPDNNAYPKFAMRRKIVCER